MEILFGEWLGTPVWLWLSFFGVVVGLLTLDLGVLHRDNREIGVRESLAMSAFYITLGLAFGGFVWWQLGPTAAQEYVTGFVVEKSLAMDNVFVIAMIFSYFAIPRLYQHRVLFWGILGVIVLRGLMIGFGTALVANFGWVLYVFAAFLIFTGVQMWRNAESEYDIANSAILKWVKRRFRVTEELHGDKFFVQLPNAKAGGAITTFVTPLFLALVMVEFVDVVFAVDSIPAIFAITTDPFIVYTSNIFAILGLRALYFALAGSLQRFAYLSWGLAAVLAFVGAKMLLADVFHVPVYASLAVIAIAVGASIVASLWLTRGGRGEPPAAATDAAAPGAETAREGSPAT